MPFRVFLCYIMVFGMAGAAAAQGLPPLRVAPSLLRGAPVAQTEPVPVLAVPATPQTRPPALAPQAGPVVPPAVPVPAVPPAAPAPERKPAARPETPPRAEPAPLPSRLTPVVAVPEQPMAPAATPAVPVHPTEPPQVTERPALPPLYSAHEAAGALPARESRPAAAELAPSPAAASAGSTWVVADRIRGRSDVEVVAEGNAELRKTDTVLHADRLSYWQLDDEVEALGSVRLERNQNLFSGPRLRMRIEENVGFFEQPQYSITRKLPASPPDAAPADAPPVKPITGRGAAERIDFEGEGLFRLSKATYSTCAGGNNDWYAEVGDLKLDYNRQVAEGSEGKVVFQGVPILYSPWLNFSLDNQRKSGLLSPTFGSTSKSGAELMVPWYWNIAPNMDATIAPRVMTKRGIQWNTDFRYLDQRYGGEAHVEYLPDDRLAHKRRYGYAIVHRQQSLGYGISGGLNLNGVSDDTYFSDLTKPAAGLAQTNLLRQGQLSYSGSWWNAALTAQRYQVLQDPSLPPAVEPYRRLPQFNLAANRYDLPFGAAFNFSGEYVKFGHPTNVVGQRHTLYPQFSLPVQTAYLQVTPKLGVHATRYDLDRQAAGTPASLTRQLPIFSIDGSLVFERDTDFFGRNLTQTLEPRVYYLYVPNRDQSQIPVFDTGVADFNFAQIFAENRYGGGDRIADANQLTAALTSRLIDPATGAELMRGLIGQRYYFTTQHVTLPAVGTNPAEVPRSERSADILAALSGLALPKTYVDAGWQYNPRDARTERLNVGGRYQPETGKVVNAGYRYTRDLLGQIDVSGQWPIAGGWHGVGRYNFSTKERRMIESVGGIEYDGGCWLARVVVQRIATQTQQATTSLFVQLELNGFSRIGSNPLDLLKRNVPGYGLINQPSADNAFASY